ncbi:MAG: EAL domain-containing protein [Bacillota bacterium]|nr:EAL domain-containing protein [Bacillota bacterium]
MTFNNSMQSKLKKMIINIILIVIAIVGLIFYVFVNNQINEKYKNESYGVINYTHLLLTQTFEDAERGIETVNNHIDGQADYASFLNVIYENIKSANTVFIGDEDGNFYLYPNRFVADDYDPRERSWYMNSIESPDQIIWSEPYIDHGTGEYTVTASRNIKLEDGSFAVVGVDILLDELRTTVKEAKIGKNGFVTVVNNSGTVIAHNNIEKLAMSWTDSEIFEFEFSELNSGQSVIKGDTYNYYVESFEKAGLELIASVKKSDILMNLIYMYSFMMGIVLIFIYYAQRIAVRQADKIITPLLKLKDVMVIAGEGDYNVKCNETSDDEIGVLIDGFNDMIQNIYENNNEMQALYEELYASEETLKEQYDELYENREFIKKSEQRYKSIFEASKEGLWDMDEQWIISYLTPGWYESFDVDLDNVKLEEWTNLVHPDEREYVKKQIQDHIEGKTENYNSEYRVKNKYGNYVWIESIGKARFDSDKTFIGMSGSHLDISVRKKYELKILDMAYKDNLTKLYNRAYFEDYLETYLAENGKGALLFVDIDNFKYINDIYGHIFGDEVLKELARRLSRLFDNDKKYLISRFSGDEFIIILKDLTEREAIIFVINAMIGEIESTIQSENKFFKVTASIGITIFPNDGTERVQLMQNSDIAMYHAKRISKRSFHFFDDEIRTKAINEMKIENNLREAILLDEFEIYYQPIMNVTEKRVTSFEALIRWNSKKLGFIYPDEFIAIAEKTGLINEIGFIVLEKSCHFIAELNKKRNSEFSISINISVIQLMEDHFANRVLSIIKKSGIPNHLVILEITESMMLENNENILAKLFYLRNQQIGISLDDFGTGYSSFNNLIRLPLTSIKMDRSIMKDSISNEHVFTLLESIVTFAHKINVEVVAEGIEDIHYLEKSKALCADYLQGYYFSRPVGENQVELLINSLDNMGLGDK